MRWCTAVGGKRLDRTDLGLVCMRALGYVLTDVVWTADLGCRYLGDLPVRRAAFGRIGMICAN